MTRVLFSIIFLAYSLLTFGSDSSRLKTLGAEQVIIILKKYHPIIRQAGINREISEAEILKARANFDPNLQSYISSKTFQSINYVEDREISLQIPTWYGIDLEGGIANLEGSRIDNSQTKGEQSYIGINVPILKNLTYDKRRAALAQAKIMNQISINEQERIVNDITFEAMTSYWTWVNKYETYRILESIVLVNIDRLEYVKKMVSYGERPAIDTIEAATQLVSFQIEKLKRWTEFLNAGNDLSTYLWSENNRPALLPNDVIPATSWDERFKSKKLNLNCENIVSDGLKFHPELKIYREKLNYYSIEKKLYFQDLLPKLDLNYRVLNNQFNPTSNLSSESFSFKNNYQYGIKFEVPLRLSAGRASYRSAKLKLNFATLDLDQKAYHISMKIKSCFNDYLNYRDLSEMQYGNYVNYKKLVAAEEIKFKNGESNLFTINARENKALEAVEKLIDYKTSYFLSTYKLQWSAGLLK